MLLELLYLGTLLCVNTMFTLKEMVASPCSLSIQGEHMKNAICNQVALMATFDLCVSNGYV